MSAAKFHVIVDGALGRVYVAKLHPAPPHVLCIEWTADPAHARTFGHPSALAIATRNKGRVVVVPSAPPVPRPLVCPKCRCPHWLYVRTEVDD